MLPVVRKRSWARPFRADIVDKVFLITKFGSEFVDPNDSDKGALSGLQPEKYAQVH